MGIHSFHLAVAPAHVTARALARGGSGAARDVDGLEHLEALSLMRLGAPAVSLERLQLRRLAVFAQWRDEGSLEAFLGSGGLGGHLASGWHVRLQFVRRWGAVTGLERLPLRVGDMEDDEPVVAVTLAHLKLPEVGRFFRWGRPVERLVRDDPAVSLALAAIRPPGTFSTFTVWPRFTDMHAMVEGHGTGSEPRRHATAMAENERDTFHHEFTTLRFRPLSEHGEWEGRRGIVPGL